MGNLVAGASVMILTMKTAPIHSVRPSPSGLSAHFLPLMGAAGAQASERAGVRSPKPQARPRRAKTPRRVRTTRRKARSTHSSRRSERLPRRFLPRRRRRLLCTVWHLHDQRLLHYSRRCVSTSCRPATLAKRVCAFSSTSAVSRPAQCHACPWPWFVGGASWSSPFSRACGRASPWPAVPRPRAAAAPRPGQPCPPSRPSGRR